MACRSVQDVLGIISSSFLCHLNTEVQADGLRLPLIGFTVILAPRLLPVVYLGLLCMFPQG
jgi:hypothetical protein